MRRRLVALAATTTIMVALAFLIPLAVLVPTLARGRALSAAELEAQSLAPVLALTPDTTALEADQTAVVRVLVPTSILERGVAAAWAVEAALGITLVASAVFVADRLARTIVRPVDALADAAGRLGEGDLSVRINPEGPAEGKQVAEAFNRLGDRVGELLEAERELVADLSHRLRTPLTVMRLDAEGLDNPEEARRLADDVDELERAVTGVIRQARKPVSEDLITPGETDAAKVAGDRLAFWAPLAE